MKMRNRIIKLTNKRNTNRQNRLNMSILIKYGCLTEIRGNDVTTAMLSLSFKDIN